MLANAGGIFHLASEEVSSFYQLTEAVVTHTGEHHQQALRHPLHNGSDNKINSGVGLVRIAGFDEVEGCITMHLINPLRRRLLLLRLLLLAACILAMNVQSTPHSVVV